MNAQEANETACKVNLVSETGQYKAVQEVIRKAAEKGLYVAYYYDSIRKDVDAKLTSEGFTVENFSDRDGITITIKWERV